MQRAGDVVSDYATLVVESLAEPLVDSASPEAGPCYAALDMPFAVHQAWPDASEILRFADPASGRCGRRGRLGGG
ncbi:MULTISPECIES: hypothetical protein [unclassified Streptomyces]|uniref:hypothetical protein n=1 Tax=unclassified Streptomyces TaxID=2593676 RepID=UPI0033D6F135